MTTNYVQCRYTRRNNELCTAEVADEHAEILLCRKHLARALELLVNAGALDTVLTARGKRQLTANRQGTTA